MCKAQKDLADATAWYYEVANLSCTCNLRPSPISGILDHISDTNQEITGTVALAHTAPNPAFQPQASQDVILDESEDGAVIDDAAIHGGTLEAPQDEDDNILSQEGATPASPLARILTRDPEASFPPMKGEAQRAYEQLVAFLEPRKNAQRYDPGFDTWTWTRLEAMKNLLWEYVNSSQT